MWLLVGFDQYQTGLNGSLMGKSKNCLLSYIFFVHVSLFQLKGSDLELTIVKGSSVHQASLNGPACAYVNARVKVGNRELGRIPTLFLLKVKLSQTDKPTVTGFVLSFTPFTFTTEGVILLENPKGDNRLDLDRLQTVCSSVFGTNNSRLRFFNGGTGNKYFRF